MERDEVPPPAEEGRYRRTAAREVGYWRLRRALYGGRTRGDLWMVWGRMAALYNRQANREKRARGAIGKLSRDKSETSIPAPMQKVRERNKNFNEIR